MLKYSVIIPTYNRATLLKNCLEAVAVQTVPRDTYEVIVINDGSRDNTDKIIDEFKKQHPLINFIYIKQKNHGVSHARNQGIKRAKGEIIFFTDDDCVVPENWIETLANGYRRHPEVAGVGGWYEYPEDMYKKSLFVNYTMLRLQKRFKNIISQKKEIKNNKFFLNPAGNTANTSYKKSVLDKFGGFDEFINFVGLVDWELKARIMKSGHSLLYVPFTVLHLKPLGYYQVMRKFFNHGRGTYHLTQKNPELLPFYCPSIFKYWFTIKRLGTLNELIRQPPFKKNMAMIQATCFSDFCLVRLGWEFQKIWELCDKILGNRNQPV